MDAELIPLNHQAGQKDWRADDLRLMSPSAPALFVLFVLLVLLVA